MPTIKRKPRPAAEKAGDGPLVAWGEQPYAGDDDANGARVGGYRLVRGWSGELVGIRELQDKPE